MTERVDTTGDAVQGGEFIGVVSSDVSSFDSGTGRSNDVAHALRAYSRLLRHKVFKYPAPVVKEVEPDAAVEWEASPDGLTYTFKLRPSFKFDPRPPTNGRVMTAEDADFSVKRFLADSRNRGDRVLGLGGDHEKTSPPCHDGALLPQGTKIRGVIERAKQLG